MIIAVLVTFFLGYISGRKDLPLWMAILGSLLGILFGVMLRELVE